MTATIADVVVLTVHARDVASEEREDFTRRAAVLERDPRALVMRTCHRVEVYAVLDGSSRASRSILPRLPHGGRRLEGVEAVRHVFACAAGLDSVVVGEDQVLHQLRDCMADRRAADEELDPVLERLLQSALRVGRAARSRREHRPRSLADLAIEEMLAGSGSLSGRRVLVMGAGRMARLVALAASRHGARVAIANRARERAVALAREVGGSVADLDDPRGVEDADGVVIAISGAWSPAASTRVRLLASSMPIIDLSAPPALDAPLRASLGTRYTSIDDLAHRPQEQLRARVRRGLERELTAAEADFLRWLRTRDAVPAITALSAEAERYRREELERLFRRTELPPHERELVEQMSRRLVAGLLHRPISALREDADGGLERATRALFSL